MHRQWTLLLALLVGACGASPRGTRSDGAAGQPDAGYICGAYSVYQAQTQGIVRSPCQYDVSKILSVGGDVKVRITPPMIDMEFPDGTRFIGSTDGVSFTAVRTTTFPFTDG